MEVAPVAAPGDEAGADDERAEPFSGRECEGCDAKSLSGDFRPDYRVF